MTRWAWIIGVTASVLLACEADTSDGSPEPTDGGSDAAQTDTGDGDVIADGTDPGDIACPTLDLECAGGEAPIDTNGDGCPDECPSAPDDVVSVPDVVADTAGDGSSSGDADIAEDAAQPCPDMAECPPTSKAIDTDGDGCEDSCATVCDTPCSCYATEEGFAEPCPLECATCDNYWSCEEGACVAQCGAVPPEVAACTESDCTEDEDCEEGDFCQMSDGQCSSAGVCKPKPGMCPPELLPVCGCDDETYSSACQAHQAGQNVAFLGPCDVSGQGTPCVDTPMCGDNAYCHFIDGLCGDAGFCESFPEGCDDAVDPVCGCDGATYSNACEAATVGVSVLEAGECGGDGAEICGGFVGAVCEDGLFCVEPNGMCAGSDIQGVCTAVPGGCPEIYDPVCGCDDQTYSSACHALQEQVQIDHVGECGGSCIWGGDPVCPKSEFCLMFEGTCVLPDWTGVCTPKPGACTFEYLPVCGCDGNTYGNECEAWAAGASIAWQGDCKNPE